MKYVRNFESFRDHKGLEPINEEFLGNIVNFFKNLWNKATEEIKKLGSNPPIDKLEQWIETNPMNPTDDTYIFKGLTDEFNKKPEANEQDCLDFVKNILDPETGALGTQGLQPLYDALKKSIGNATIGGGKPSTIEIVKFYFEKIRNRAIKDFKYAGGPDLKIDPKVPAKIDPKKIILDIKDTTHLPDYKKVLLTAGQDNKKRKQLALDWVNKTLVPRLDKYLDDDYTTELEKYLELSGVPVPESGPEGGYKPNDSVIYKREKFNEDEWKKVTDADKLKPNEGILKDLQDKEMIGIKPIKDIKGEDVNFEKEDGTLFTKKLGELLGKVEAKAEGQEDLVKKLGELKTKKPEDIKKVNSFVDFISDEKNKDKVAEIDKILAAGEGE